MSCAMSRGVFPVPNISQTAADGRNRTDDLLITSQLLYQLSYIGRGLKTENYSQGTTLSRRSQFEVLASFERPHMRVASFEK